MPSYYAHHVFGQKVLACLPVTLRKTVAREKDAFEAGLYGPDPLFFHPSPMPRLRNLAHTMHYSDARPVAERLFQAVRDDLPMARGYAAGFLCHFALDCRCHYYIEERLFEDHISHAGSEAELDRFLMLRDGLDPLRETPMDRLRLPPSFGRTLNAVFPQITPGQFFASCRAFRRACQVQTRLAGTGVYRAVNWVGVRYPRLSAVRGTVLTPIPNPVYDASTAALARLLEDEVVPTARAVSRFFAAVSREGSALDGWYDRPFSGRWRPEDGISSAKNA